MKRHRIFAATAVTAVLTLGGAGAAMAGGQYPPSEPNPTVTSVDSSDDTASAGSLPRTGSEIALAGAAGAALVVGGSLLVRGARRQRS